MTGSPRMSLSGIVLDSPEPRSLAAFYQRLLDWRVRTSEPTWVTLDAPGGGTALSIQLEPRYTRPTWPSADGRQQMQAHLDIGVDDLEAAGAHALAAGASLADFQPQEAVRVYLDPDGHPFCLFRAG